MKKLIQLWQNLPPQVRKWLKGLEVAVVSALLAGLSGAPLADLKSKSGVAKFAGYILTVVYGAVRLYLAQSPVQTILKESVTAEQTTKAGVTTVTAEKITQ